jgi:hypothetical protein
MAPRSYVHGTNYAYEYAGCRCDQCCAFQRERVARNRADRLADGRLTHGTRSAWDAGCRCLACLDRRRAAYPRERARAG